MSDGINLNPTSSNKIYYTLYYLYMEFDGVRSEGLLWIKEQGNWKPVCPKHYLRLSMVNNQYDSSTYECGEDKERFCVKREHTQQKKYIQNKLDAKDIQRMKFLNIDGESIVLVDDKVNSSDSKYFVKALLTESKVGLRLVVYAGEKGKEKSQIFVEPEIRRLAFDQNDTHPSEVFLKLEATFDDGSIASMKKGNKKDPKIQ